MCQRTIVKFVIFILFALCLTCRSAIADDTCQGMTPVELRGSEIVVNHVPTKIKAVSYTVPRFGSEGFPSLETVRQDFVAIKRIGFNTIRTYEPLPPAVIDLAEEQHLFVIEALVHLSDATNFGSEEFLQEVIENTKNILNRDRCRSAIVMWSIWNDAPFNWGSSGGNVVERFGYAKVHSFLERLRDSVRDVDASRPITGANVLNAKHADLGFDLLDVIGVNAYLGVFEWKAQKYSERLAQSTAKRIEKIGEKYGKPVWVSETGISTIVGADSAEIVIPAQIRLISRYDLLGFSIFQWRDDPLKASGGSGIAHDVEANWGLLTAKGIPKPAFGRIAETLGVSEDLTSEDSIGKIGWVKVNRDPDRRVDLLDRVLDGFSFKDTNSLRNVYRLRSKGNSHYYYSMPTIEGKPASGLRLLYEPEDYGAWMVLGRSFEKPILMNSDELLVLEIASKSGGAVNLTVELKLANGRRVISPPLLLIESVSQSYQARISDFVSIDSPLDSSLEVTEISLRLSDVPNHEQISVPVDLRMDRILIAS